MPDLTSTATAVPIAIRDGWVRTAGRWMVSFAGFPIGGYAGTLIAGPVDDLTAALIGGLITGVILGAAQSWAMVRGGPPSLQWVAATAIGLMLGLGVGSAAVDYHTDLGALMIQGAISGLAVGIAQAFVLRHRLRRLLVLLWAPVLTAVWALGWFITTAAGIAVEEQFIVFGASGALVVTGLTTVLPIAVRRQSASRS
jgi:hypothetical protein